MGIFYNPLDGPLTGRKIAGIAVYLILAIISIWATSESISGSFNVPIIISYLLGIAFVATMALLLGVIKQMLEERRVKLGGIVFLIFAFLIVWGVSLSTNAHKLFTQLKLEDIRKNELDKATIALENIETNSTSVGNQVINDYEVFVVSRIQNYKKEVLNIENCGHGKVADTLMSKVQRSMPGSIFTLPSGRQRTESGCRKLANDMTSLMTTALNSRVTSMREKLANLGKCNNDEKARVILESLEEKNSFLTDFATREVKQSISDAHEYYNKLYECYNEGLIENIGSVKDFTDARDFKNKLELPVPSIDLEKISELIPFVKNYPKEDPGSYFNSFLLSIAIAFILDLAAFIILYYVIFKE